MPHLPEFISLWIMHYGNAALFVLLALGIVGLPIPDETLLAFAGYLIAHQKLPFYLTYIVAFGGAICGITLSYYLGRAAGYFILFKYGYWLGITENRINKVHDWFERFGKWLLFFGYFIMGIRHLTGIAAGAAKLNWKSFMLFAYTGAVLWAASFITLGYFFTQNWHEIIPIVRNYVWGIVAVGVIILGGYFIYRYFKRQL